jgi:hypothetical protein
MWISRANKLQNDNWRYDLRSLAPGNNILLLRESDIDKNLHPILYDLVVDYNSFYDKFCTANSNFKKAYIFGNQSFKLGPDYARPISANSFGLEFYNRYKNFLRALTFENCFSQGSFKPLADFAAEGLPLSPAAWMQLRSSLLRTKALLTKPDSFPHNNVTDITSFMNSNAKGSKRFRRVFDYVFPEPDVTIMRSINTFSNLIELPVPDAPSIKKILGSWTHYCCGNQLKEFIFKFRSNYLDLNNRINAFNQEVDPRCTFCRIRDPDTNTRDSLSHCFFDCPTTNGILQPLLTKYFPDLATENQKKYFFWYGLLPDPEQNHLQQTISLCMDNLRFIIYRYKKRRIVPNYITVEKDFIFGLKTTIMTSQSFKSIVASENIFTIIYRALG